MNFPFRIISISGVYLVQREYWVVEDNDPQHHTEWRTMSILKDYTYTYEFVAFRQFESIISALWFLRKPTEMSTYSASYRNFDEPQQTLNESDITDIWDIDRLKEEYPEGWI